MFVKVIFVYIIQSFSGHPVLAFGTQRSEKHLETHNPLCQSISIFNGIIRCIFAIYFHTDFYVYFYTGPNFINIIITVGFYYSVDEIPKCFA